MRPLSDASVILLTFGRYAKLSSKSTDGTTEPSASKKVTRFTSRKKNTSVAAY